MTGDEEAKAVLQETLALLKILALGNRQIETGDVEPAAAVIQRLRKHRSKR